MAMLKQDIINLRHATHYINVLRTLHNLYLAGTGLQEGLTTFDMDWPNIAAGQEWSRNNAERLETAADLCIQFPLAGFHILNLRLPSQTHLSWLQQAASFAEKNGDTVRLAKVNGNMGIIYKNMGECHRR